MAGLWDWASRAYAEPDVARLCLELQDAHGQSVCLLLWAAWAALDGRTPSAATLAQAIGLARVWNRDVIEPLRGARLGLAGVSGLTDTARQALKAQIQQSELSAERALLEALAASTPADKGAPSDPARAMAQACAAWGIPAPDALLAALADAFPPV